MNHTRVTIALPRTFFSPSIAHATRRDMRHVRIRDSVCVGSVLHARHVDMSSSQTSAATSSPAQLMAAAAGDARSRFSVVAREVRSLAVPARPPHDSSNKRC